MNYFVLVVFIISSGIWENIFSQIPNLNNHDSYLETTLTHNFFDIYRSESKTSKVKSYFAKSNLQLDYKKNNFSLSLGIEIPKLSIESYNNRDNTFSFKGVSGRKNIEPKVFYKGEIVEVGGSITFYEKQKLNKSAFNSFVTLKFQPTILHSFKLELAKRNLSLLSDISYSTEDVTFNNDLTYYELSQTFDVGKIFNADWRLETFQKWKFDENKISQEHYLNNSGNLYGVNISTDFLDKRLSLSTGYLTGDAKFVFEYDKKNYGEEKFSDVVMIRGEITSTLFSKDNLIDEIKIGLLNIKSKSIGEIQSWPFTDVITSSIANRIYYRGSFNITNYYLQIRNKYKISSVEISPEILFLHLIPKGELENWQPLFLVFGVKNFQQSKIMFRSIGLIHLGLELKFEFNNYLLTLASGQIIPIYQNKIETLKIGQPSSTQSVKHKTDGGRWYFLSIKHLLIL